MSSREDVRVLIVEDDYLSGEMVRGLLKEMEYTVVGEAIEGLKLSRWCNPCGPMWF